MKSRNRILDVKVNLFAPKIGLSLMGVIPKTSFIVFFFVLCLVIFPFFACSQDNSANKKNSNAIEIADVEYTAFDFRDPFDPQIFIFEKEEKEEPEMEEDKIEEVRPKPSELFSFTIQGIMWNPDTPIAIMNDQVLQKGDVLLMEERGDISKEVSVIDIDKSGVVIVYDGEMEKLPYPSNTSTSKKR